MFSQPVQSAINQCVPASLLWFISSGFDRLQQSHHRRGRGKSRSRQSPGPPSLIVAFGQQQPIDGVDGGHDGSVFVFRK